MTSFFGYPALSIFFVVLSLLALAASSVASLWIASFAALFLSFLALGGRRAPLVLVWIITLNFLQVWADIFLIDLSALTSMPMRVLPNQAEAIYNSSAALLFLSVGMRAGLLVSRNFKKRPDSGQAGHATDLLACSSQRLVLMYLAFLPFAALAIGIGAQVPGLAQPAYMFGMLRFVLVYWLSAAVFASNRDYKWLIAVLAIELVMGSAGNFSSYKEAIFVMLIAFAGSGRSLSLRQFGLTLSCIAIVVYMSLVWTDVKKEFRTHISTGDPVASVFWLADRYLRADVDFSHASIKLLERMGYTRFYGMVIGRRTEAFKGNYERAVLHILTPRMFFPGKAILNDSAQTSLILGERIDANTSISLGYVAQAHIDFGFPGLAVPLSALGAVVAMIYSYFLSRPAPSFLCEAFAVGCLFNALRFEGNIDKQLGGIVMGFLVLGIIMRYGGPSLVQLAAWKPQLIRGHAGRVGY